VIALRFLVNLALFLLPATPFAAVAHRLSRASQDEWQLLAWVPVLPLGIWGVIIAWATTRDKTSHNLWPFEMIVWGGLSLFLLVGVLVGRWLASKSSRPTRLR
jgi:uncharacterized membrane protein YsdA (DUF1294 family)